MLAMASRWPAAAKDIQADVKVASTAKRNTPPKAKPSHHKAQPRKTSNAGNTNKAVTHTSTKAASKNSSGKNVARPAFKATAKTKPQSKNNATAKTVPISGHILAPAAGATGTASPRGNAPTSQTPRSPDRPERTPLAVASTAATAAIDVNAVKRAVDFVRQRKQSEATAIQNSIADPVARKLVEWLILRSDDSSA